MAVLNIKVTKCFDDAADLVPLLLLADPAFFLVDLDDGFAGGHIDIHGLGHIPQRLTSREYAVNDDQSALFAYLFIGGSFGFISLTHLH